MKHILFDLDATLLQMDQDEFIKLYFNSIKAKFSSYVNNIEEFMCSFMSSAYNIISNDGNQTNEELFFKNIKCELSIPKLKEIFNSYYDKEFKEIRKIVDDTIFPKLIIDYLKDKGYMLYLATNPLFPMACTYERIKWAGLNPDDFTYISTYENSMYCKPKLEYYNELAKKNNFSLSDSVMIGNDVDDDFKYLPKEVKKIIVTNHLINKNNKDISSYKCLTIEELYNYIQNTY